MIETISRKVAGTVKSTVDKKLPIFVNNAPAMRMTMQHRSLTMPRPFPPTQNAKCESAAKFEHVYQNFLTHFGTDSYVVLAPIFVG